MKALTILAASALLSTTALAIAGQPENPGAFGRDRAAALKSFQSDDTAPGASEWGHIAGERGSMNGEINRDYRNTHGGSPTPGNDTGDDDDDGGDND